MTRISRLEEALYADAEGNIRDLHLDQLRAYELEMRVQLRLPQTPERYAQLQRIMHASENARRVIETIWRRYHGK